MRYLIYFLLLCAISSCKTSPKETTRYDNVIVIVGDDHASTVVGCYGNEQIKTPNIDRLAQNGIRFTNAYSNSPICSASRQSMLTGKYPHATGVNLLFTPFNDTQNYTIPEHLQNAGFNTCIIGKTHFNDWIWGAYYDEWPTYGFETIIGSSDWKKNLEKNPPKNIDPSVRTRKDYTNAKDIRSLKNAEILPSEFYDKDSEGTFFANKAVEYIRNNNENRFFLWLAFHEPHAPFNFPVEYAGKYKTEDMILPAGSDEDDRWIPEVFKDLSNDERKGIIASYYTSVEYMDKNVGIVLKGLEDAGLKEKTLVIYLGDQGYLLNDHKRFEKHTMWAESVKAPLVISGHGLPNNKEISRPVEFVDLASTVCEATGIQLHKEFQGTSLLDLIKGNTDDHKKYIFSEYLEDNKAMVADENWKYIFATGKRDLGIGYATGHGPSGLIHRLYDLKNDPKETTNLAYHNEHQQKVMEMQNAMLDKFVQTHPNAKNVPSGLNLIGKILWFCEPNDVGDEPFDETPDRIFEFKK